MPTKHLLLLICAGFLWHCSSSSKKSETEGNTFAIFSPDATGHLKQFWDAPYPSDLRLLDDHRVDLSQCPGRAGNGVIDEVLQKSENEILGAGLTTALYLPFSAAIATQNMPEPWKTLEKSSVLQLINIEPGSEHYLERVPLVFFWYDKSDGFVPDNTLAAMPYPGWYLEENGHYALIVLKQLRDAKSKLLRQADGFKALLAGKTAAHTLEINVKLKDALKAAKISVNDVAVASLFTTQQATWKMRSVADYVRTLTPATPQLETPNTASSCYDSVEGSFDSWNFQDGVTPYTTEGGAIHFDAQQQPQLQGSMSVKFAFSVPKGTPPASGWPLVFFGHGSGGDHTNFLDGLACKFAQKGFAMASLDAAVHGARNTSGMGSDWLFNNPLNPASAIGNPLQTVADYIQLLSVLSALSENGFSKFDSSAFFYVSQSLGGWYGTLLLASDSRLRAAAMNGAGGETIVLILPGDDHAAPMTTVATVLGIDPANLHRFNFMLNLAQQYSEFQEPVLFAPDIFYDSKDNAPKPVVLLEGLLDNDVTNVATEALATSLRAPLLKPFGEDMLGLTMRLVDPVNVPAMNNVATKSHGGVTSGVQQFPDQGHFALDYDRRSVPFVAAFFSSVLSGQATLNSIADY